MKRHLTQRILLFLIVSTLFSGVRVYAGAEVDYVLTAPADPVMPGHFAEFDVTARNLTGMNQGVILKFIVPQHATYPDGADPSPGSQHSINLGQILQGTSESAKIRFLIDGGNQSPPDGTPIDVTLTDEDRAITVPGGVVVVANPVLDVDLLSSGGTVGLGQNFTYRAIASNVSPTAVTGTQLSVQVPAGSTFVGATGNFVLNGDLVQWSFGTMASGENKVEEVTFVSSATPNTPLKAVVATFSDAGGHLAHASDARGVYNSPAVDYVLTPVSDPIIPGHFAEFEVTARNLTNVNQGVILNFTIPEGTSYPDGATTTPGSFHTLNFGQLLPGSSGSFKVRFQVLGGNQSPRDGTVIPINMFDLARGASVSRSVIVRSAPPLNVRLSTNNGTVAPGQDFSYTVIASNVSGTAASNVQLTVPVPSGATFVNAPGATLTNGVVHWPLFNTLAAFENRQFNVVFHTNPGANNPLGIVEATLSDSAGHVARSSDSRSVYALPAVDYVITAPADPIVPGHFAEFDVTVRNLTNLNQGAILNFTIPEGTAYPDGATTTPGSFHTINFGQLLPGTSESTKVRFQILGGNQSPPNGTTVLVKMFDLDRGGSVSRSVIIRSAPTLNLQLSTANGTVAPGGNFTYTLFCSNSGLSDIPGLELSVPLPLGATFISADGGGQIGADNIVRWPVGTLVFGANRQFHVTFQAEPVTDNPLGPVQATLMNSTGAVARASDTRVIYVAPAFSYTLTAVSDAVAPGGNADFNVTVHNLSGSAQSVILYFTIPENTTYPAGAITTPGSVHSLNFGQVATGGMSSMLVRLTIPAGNQAPPNGTIATLNLMDLARGASVSKTIRIGSIPPPKSDFNGDLHPDWILQNASTYQNAIWFMNDFSRTSSVYAPTSPGWTVIDAKQFGGAGTSADLLLYNASTHRSAIWYMNGGALSSAVYGPTITAGWTLVLAQDFNSDTKPDLLLFNPTTRRTAVWYLNGAFVTTGVYGPTLPAGWTITGAADFNGDGKQDLVLYRASTRQTAVWYLNGVSYTSSAYGPTLPSGWTINSVDDFNRDGKPDFALWHAGAHRTAIWHLNNTALTSSGYGPTTPVNWVLRAPK